MVRIFSKQWIKLHSYNVRICHWINVIASGYLLISGIHIFLDFPELYWGHTGYQGYPAIFKLSDWGISWDDAGALGDRMWGRNYHITFAWVFLINGFVYVVWNIWTAHFRDRMIPHRNEISIEKLQTAVQSQLSLTGPKRHAPDNYGILQKLSYVLLIFVFTPFMILTGIAQSPGFTAAIPSLLDLFGGRQSPRSLHTIGTIFLVLFVVVHVLEVVTAGAWNKIRAMVTGNLALQRDKE